MALAIAGRRAGGRGTVGAVLGVIGCLHMRYVQQPRERHQGQLLGACWRAAWRPGTPPSAYQVAVRIAQMLGHLASRAGDDTGGSTPASLAWCNRPASMVMMVGRDYAPLEFIEQRDRRVILRVTTGEVAARARQVPLLAVKALPGAQRKHGRRVAVDERRAWEWRLITMHIAESNSVNPLSTPPPRPRTWRKPTRRASGVHQPNEPRR